MKKFFLYCFMAALFLTVFQLFAAAQENKLFTAGIKAGANFNQVHGKYWSNGYKANFMGGVFAGLGKQKFGVQAEALFSQNTFVTGSGFRSLYQDAINPNNMKDSNGTFKVSQLHVPLLINIRILTRVLLQAGPQFSGIVSIQDKNDFLKDSKSIFKSGWDGVVGLQINLPAGLHIGARYIFGLSNINNTSFTNPYNGKEIEDIWKSRSFQVHLGIAFL